MPNKLSTSRRSLRGFGWVALFLLAALAFTWVAVPVFKIRPFAPQTPQALRLSYVLRSWSPALTVAALTVALPVLKDYWFDWKIYNPRTLVYSIGAQ